MVTLHVLKTLELWMRGRYPKVKKLQAKPCQLQPLNSGSCSFEVKCEKGPGLDHERGSWICGLLTIKHCIISIWYYSLGMGNDLISLVKQ